MPEGDTLAGESLQCVGGFLCACCKVELNLIRYRTVDCASVQFEGIDSEAGLQHGTANHDTSLKLLLCLNLWLARWDYVVACSPSRVRRTTRASSVFSILTLFSITKDSNRSPLVLSSLSVNATSCSLRLRLVKIGVKNGGPWEKTHW